MEVCLSGATAILTNSTSRLRV